MSYSRIESDIQIPHRQYSCDVRRLARYCGSGTCVAVALSALGLLSAQIANGEIEPTASALETAAIGIALRTFQHINLDTSNAREINNFIARWNLAGFEALWQAYLNMESTVGKDVIAHFVSGLFGYSLTNDFFNFITQKRGDQPNRLLDLSRLTSNEINRGTGFTIDAPKRRFLLHGLIATVGVAAIIFGYQTDYLPHEMVTTAGYFLTLFGVGSIGTQVSLMKKRDELSQQYIYDLSPIDLSEGEINPQETRGKRFWRYLFNGGQLVLPSAMVFALFMNGQLSKLFKFSLSPFVFGAAGVVSGVNTTLRQVGFGRNLTEEVHQAQLEPNQTINREGQPVRSTALKIDTCVATIFTALFTLWFGYGIYESSTKGKIGIALLMGSAYLSGLLTLVSDIMFRPGRSNRLINFLRYIFVENSDLLPLGSLYFTSSTKITDTSLELSSDEQFIFGLMGLFMFGMFLGNVTSLNISKTRPSPAFSSVASIFEMGTTFFMMLFGKKPSQLA
ncbi:MAG: hypothetical protein ACSNEK_06175 [Parachlamydiaceae bacterium]